MALALPLVCPWHWLRPWPWPWRSLVLAISLEDAGVEPIQAADWLVYWSAPVCLCEQGELGAAQLSGHSRWLSWMHRGMACSLRQSQPTCLNQSASYTDGALITCVASLAQTMMTVRLAVGAGAAWHAWARQQAFGLGMYIRWLHWVESTQHFVTLQGTIS